MTDDKPVQYRVASSGVRQHVSTEHQDEMDKKFDEEIEYSIKIQEHYWVATMVYKLSVNMARKMVKGHPDGEPSFDTENLMVVEFGCYICEQPLDSQLAFRRCPGEPRE